MRLVKAFLVGATGLFIIITLFSLLIPSRVMVSRGVLINNASLGDVYPEIAHIDNWKNWHPVFTIDSAKLYQGTPDNASFRIVHRGKDIFIRLLSADSTSVKFLLQSPGEDEIDNDILITPLTSQHATQVEWRAIIKLRWYPWEKFYGIFLDHLAGPSYEAALKSLKDYIEKNPGNHSSTSQKILKGAY